MELALKPTSGPDGGACERPPPQPLSRTRRAMTGTNKFLMNDCMGIPFGLEKSPDFDHTCLVRKCGVLGHFVQVASNFLEKGTLRDSLARHGSSSSIASDPYALYQTRPVIQFLPDLWSCPEQRSSAVLEKLRCSYHLDDRKECLGIELPALLGCSQGCHDQPRSYLRVIVLPCTADCSDQHHLCQNEAEFHYRLISCRYQIRRRLHSRVWSRAELQEVEVRRRIVRVNVSGFFVGNRSPGT